MHSHTHALTHTCTHTHTYALTHICTACPHHLQTPLCKYTHFLKFTWTPHISTRGAFMVICGHAIYCHQMCTFQVKVEQGNSVFLFQLSYCKHAPFVGLSSITFFASLPFWWFFCLKCPPNTVLKPWSAVYWPQDQKSCDVFCEENYAV